MPPTCEEALERATQVVSTMSDRQKQQKKYEIYSVNALDVVSHKSYLGMIEEGDVNLGNWRLIPYSLVSDKLTSIGTLQVLHLELHRNLLSSLTVVQCPLIPAQIHS